MATSSNSNIIELKTDFNDGMLAYKHVSPFPALNIQAPADDGTQGNMLGLGLGHASVLGVHQCIVFKFSPTFQFFDCFDEVIGQYRFGGKRTETASPQVYAMRCRMWMEEYHQSIKASIAHEGEMLDYIAAELRRRSCIYIIRPHLATPEGLFYRSCAAQSEIKWIPQRQHPDSSSATPQTPMGETALTSACLTRKCGSFAWRPSTGEHSSGLIQ